MRKSYLKSRLPDFFKHDMTHTIQLKTLLTLTWRHHIHDDPDEGSPVSFCFSISCIPQVSCISFYWTEKYHKSLNFTFYNFSKLSQSHSLILLLDFLLTLFYIWNRIKIAVCKGWLIYNNQLHCVHCTYVMHFKIYTKTIKCLDDRTIKGETSWVRGILRHRHATGCFPNFKWTRTSGRSAPLVLVPGFEKECD